MCFREPVLWECADGKGRDVTGSHPVQCPLKAASEEVLVQLQTGREQRRRSCGVGGGAWLGPHQGASGCRRSTCRARFPTATDRRVEHIFPFSLLLGYSVRPGPSPPREPLRRGSPQLQAVQDQLHPVPTGEKAAAPPGAVRTGDTHVREPLSLSWVHCGSKRGWGAGTGLSPRCGHQIPEPLLKVQPEGPACGAQQIEYRPSQGLGGPFDPWSGHVRGCGLDPQ